MRMAIYIYIVCEQRSLIHSPNENHIAPNKETREGVSLVSRVPRQNLCSPPPNVPSPPPQRGWGGGGVARTAGDEDWQCILTTVAHVTLYL